MEDHPEYFIPKKELLPVKYRRHPCNGLAGKL
jgi:hypothetical protein